MTYGNSYKKKQHIKLNHVYTKSVQKPQMSIIFIYFWDSTNTFLFLLGIEGVPFSACGGGIFMVRGGTVFSPCKFVKHSTCKILKIKRSRKRYRLPTDKNE